MDVYPHQRILEATAPSELERWALLEGKSDTAAADLRSRYAVRGRFPWSFGELVARIVLHLALWTGETWALG